MKRALLFGLVIFLWAGQASAAEVTLRLHHFLQLTSAVPANGITPWIEKIEAESNGRIKIEQYPSMQLGGSPTALYGQARDGFVDIIWTVLGYTPGIFPTAEAFELPFIAGKAAPTSYAFHHYMVENGQKDLEGVHPLALHVHSPGVLHVKGKAVRKVADLKGKKLRGPTRVITHMLGAFGAIPVGMPVPAVPEALSKGVIDGAALPYEVTVPLKIAELTTGHTGFAEPPYLYTAAIGLLMNKERYDSLPPDLREIIDRNSGPELARIIGGVMDAADVEGIRLAEADDGEVIFLDNDAKREWQDAAAPVIDNWVSEMNSNNYDGEGLLAKAKEAIAKYQ